MGRIAIALAHVVADIGRGAEAQRTAKFEQRHLAAELVEQRALFRAGLRIGARHQLFELYRRHLLHVGQRGQHNTGAHGRDQIDKHRQPQHQSH